MTLQLSLQRNIIKPFSHSLKALANIHPAIIILLTIATTIQWKCLNCNALILQCPLYQMHLQKIVGFRPPLEYMTEHNLIYKPDNHYKDRHRYARDGYPIMDQQTPPPLLNNSVLQFQSTASSECWRICSNDDGCLAYVHLLDTNECYGYSYFERSQMYMAVGNNLPLVADGEAVFYEKTCLKVPDTCKQRLWTLTKIPGNSLVFQGKKTISTLVTRRECAERCLFEHEFQCLSASFAPSHRNNHERFLQEKTAAAKHQNILGRCILSDKDKMIQPDAFRAAPYDEEYMENQCYERPVENDQCSYELYANSTFLYAETKIAGLNQKECQSYCSHETRFYCQGVSFYFDGDLDKSECLLHSEDIISMGPRSLKLRMNSVYMRRVKCLDVQVLCTPNEMSIRYSPKDWFQGKMYVSMHSKECMVHGNGTQSTVLKLAIGSEAKENKCGILRAYEVTKEYQRIFISTLVVIQNNPNVQTQGDRLIKVGCIMSNTTLADRRSDDEDSEGTEINLNHGDEDETTEQDKDEDNMPNAIALESSLEFAQSFLPNEGSLHFNASDFHPMPKITLQIIDLAHDHETNDVQIGQSLELQIVAEYTAQQQREFAHIGLPALPDFRATSLIAKTMDKQNFVLLLDARGCPTDVTVFPGLERQRLNNRNILMARFHAFKFAGSSLVNFDVRIHFCSNRCPDDNCLSSTQSAGGGSAWYPIQSEMTKSKRRRRRQIVPPQNNFQQFKVQNPVYISTVMDVVNLPEKDTTPTTSENETTSDSIPLNFNLHVRGPDNTNTNSFIYGERGVLLIAGIDDQLHMESICMNQSLLIALLIFWLIFQIGLMFSCCFVIQKYKRLAMMDDERRKIHESLEYLEGRRVHWADQGGYTL
uniref:ZP domain-containing protein n=1 Tax=Musca domestica TaxID=7370 RepID=A0A1I8NAG5_MUSDO